MSESSDAEALSALVGAASLSVDEQARAIALFGALTRRRVALPPAARPIRRWRLTEERLRSVCAVARSWGTSTAQARDHLQSFVDAMMLILVRSNAELLSSEPWSEFVRSFAATAELAERPVGDEAFETVPSRLLNALPSDAWVQSLVATGRDLERLPSMLDGSRTLSGVLDALIIKRLRDGAPVALTVIAALAAHSGASAARLPIRPSARWAAESGPQHRRSLSLGRLAPFEVDARLVYDRASIELRLLAAPSVITHARFGEIERRSASGPGPGPNETWSLVGEWPLGPKMLVVATATGEFAVSIALDVEEE